jgi:hypothetical protein
MVSKHRFLLGFIARLALVGGVACAVVGVTDTAAAQPSDKELREARATFQAGLALEAAGDFKNALVKFREVAAVRQTPNVTYHIAVCLEQLGRWTEALGTYRMTIDSAREEGAQNVAEQADEARQKLEARMPRLQLLRGKGAAGAVVELDGVRIGAASFGVEMPADPGGHRVVATIDGKTVFSQTVVLKEGRLETVTISAKVDEPPPPPTPPVENPKPSPIGPSQRTGYIFLGAGVTSLVVGGMFVKLRNDTIDQLESQCMGTRCDPSLEDTSDRGKIYMMAANAFLGVGVISAGIGTVVLMQSNGKSASPSEPVPAPASVGVSLGGPKGPGATLWGKF